MQNSSAATTRRTAPKQERVQQLIDAAMITIAEHGLSGTTTALLTQQAGLSAGIISLHFGNKDKLLEATLESLVQEHRSRWMASIEAVPDDPAARLWALMEAHFTPEICTPTKIAVWFAFFGESGHRATYRRISESFDTERSDFMDACCEQLIAQGGYSVLDPERLSHLIESTADGLWLDMLLYPEEMDVNNAREQMRMLLHFLFPHHFAAPSKPIYPDDR
ncbi:MAG: TetR family transcriptional regulator C-terminal domain-containing protein [Rhodobacteraceae bacterium]|nr:TetR family transcriptional regulator C-terminal domain-containing protein [Paracoccaceae bacterium]TVR47517.1 MAG: TetR family transcriptional regulator [Paracoccaceae bacterium]